MKQISMPVQTDCFCLKGNLLMLVAVQLGLSSMMLAVMCACQQCFYSTAGQGSMMGDL